ncbi:MAG: GumC family protein [Desulfobulbaceae bacterium]
MDKTAAGLHPNISMQQQAFEQNPFEQSLTLRDYLNILNKRRLTVLTVFLIVFVISLIMGLSKDTPRYTSASTILLERNFGVNNSGLGTYYYWDPEFLPTQTEIIKSKKVALKVVENLQLDVKYRNHFLNPLQSEQSPVATFKNALTGFLTGLFAPEERQPAGIGGGEGPEEIDEKNLIADIIKENIEVKPVKETRVVNILYTDTDPEVARMITDALVQAYIEENLEIKLSGTKQSLKWMTSKAEEERKKLEEAEGKLQQYMREHNLVTLEDRLAVYPEKLSQFSTDLSSAQAKRKELESLLGQIKSLQDSPQALESTSFFSENATLQSLRDQVLKADQRIKELSQKFGPKHPSMIKAHDDRDVLMKEKNQEIQRIIESIHKSYELAKSQEDNLRELLNSTKEELLSVNERFIQYTIMKREVESSRALYEALTSSLKQASVTEESQNINIWVMHDASLPQSPSNQKPRRSLLIGLILGLAAGIGIALLVEYLDNTVKSPADLENRYGLTVLGTVLQTRKNESIENIISENNRSPVAENYRMIRSSLLLSSADQPPQFILITSMMPQEGKTSTALNLARTLAQVTDKVLIIDADMRKPRIHQILGLDNRVGLSSFLSGNVSDTIILSTGEEKIRVIPAGPIPPNPAELISSQRMKILLKELAKDYSFIIIDSPPLSHLADGLILSTLVDGTVLVTRTGKTTFEEFGAGLKKMQDFKPHILGVILNAMASRFSGRQSYHDYYEYYSEDQKKQEKD